MKQPLKGLMQIPGVGKSIAQDLIDIGIYQVSDIKLYEPEQLYQMSNEFAGCKQDRCLLYVFRTAVYYANTPKQQHEAEKLKWWNWSDDNIKKNGFKLF